ncbi:AMP-binding protein [Pseudonocardia saturnea]
MRCYTPATSGTPAARRPDRRRRAGPRRRARSVAWCARAPARAGIRRGNAAATGYTSGTTGDPKGVLHSHRITVLRGDAVRRGGVEVSPTKRVRPVTPDVTRQTSVSCRTPARSPDPPWLVLPGTHPTRGPPADPAP